VRKADAALVRGVVEALADPDGELEAVRPARAFAAGPAKAQSSAGGGAPGGTSGSCSRCGKGVTCELPDRHQCDFGGPEGDKCDRKLRRGTRRSMMRTSTSASGACRSAAAPEHVRSRRPGAVAARSIGGWPSGENFAAASSLSIRRWPTRGGA